MDSYKRTLDYIFEHLPMFQRSGPPAYKHSLDNTLQLDKLYNHPHRNFKSVHVAGTNGKGSVSHMLASVLQEAGYKTGLYTSPHLKDFRERIKVNGHMIDKDYVVTWIENFREKNAALKIEPSFFELTVTMAFDYFSHRNVEIAVIEVGLGGRLDSTNIISPEISIITNIGYDHTNLLGNTLEKIAFEKAGIIKKKTPVVIGKLQEEIRHVFQDKAGENKADLVFANQEYSVDYSMLALDGKQVFNLRKGENVVYPDLKIDLAGMYQLENVITVIKSLELLKEKGWKISESQIYMGLGNVVANTGLLGRWQTIGYNPLIICDTGHNEDGIQMVVNQLKNTAFKKLHFIIGAVNDKNMDRILAILPKEAVYYFTKADIPRALDENILMEMATMAGLIGNSYSSVQKAFEAAKKAANNEDLIFIGGSTFVVAEIL
ncbi:MAG: bifunctional folylpolyglutamate synthase/dihydrofolate synthase [Prolixibacteraceae bacterium]|nr:bifunctional folylpolyglutamate synthase/dihydrofolate synthase [Prolixibacteraceae bacterium]